MASSCRDLRHGAGACVRRCGEETCGRGARRGEEETSVRGVRHGRHGGEETFVRGARRGRRGEEETFVRGARRGRRGEEESCFRCMEETGVRRMEAEGTCNGREGWETSTISAPPAALDLQLRLQ